MKKLIVRLVIVVLVTILAYLGFMFLEESILRYTSNSIVESQMQNTNSAIPAMNTYQTIMALAKVLVFGGLLALAGKFVYDFIKGRKNDE